MKKKTLNILIFFSIITVLIWTAYFYILNQVKSTSTSFEDTKHKIIFAMKKEQAIENSKRKIQANLKDGLDLNDFLIKPDQTADVVQAIEGFGPLIGTKVTTQSVSTEEAVGLPEGVEFLKVLFSIEGTKNNVSKNISLIENLPYNLKINRLSFAKSGDASSTSKWTSSVELELVKLKDSDATSTIQ